MLLMHLAPLTVALLGAASLPPLPLVAETPTATTVIEVSLLSPDGPLALPPPGPFREGWPPTRVSWNYLDRSYPHHWDIGGASLRSVAGSHQGLFTVDRHRPVGILGYSRVHGLVEKVISPQMMAGKERLAVELLVPPARPQGKLHVDMTFDFDRSHAAPEHLTLLGPLTECTVEFLTVPSSHSSVELDLPQGDYIASMWPRNENPFHCYSEGPSIPAGVQLWRPVSVISAQKSTLRHAFEFASGFSLRLDVRGREDAVADGLAELSKSLPGTIFRLFDEPDGAPAPGWTVQAVLIPMAESSNWSRRRLTLAWNKRTQEMGATVAPIGTTLWTLDLVPPGEYVIELSGPWIKPASFEIAVEDRPNWLWDQAPAHRFQVEPKD